MNVKPAVKITVEEYEKLLRLKELNREMVEILGDIHTLLYVNRLYIPANRRDETISRIEKVLAKVEGETGE